MPKGPRGPAPTLDYATLKDALARHGGCVAMVARQYGLSRQAVYGSIKRYGIRRKLTKAERSAMATRANTVRWGRRTA